MLNIVLFGPPGAGKGTQAVYLRDSFKLIHLSTGDLLRTQIAAQTEQGKAAQQFMDRGEFVPDEVVIEMIGSQINNNRIAHGFIFDGFPRTVAQAKALDELLNNHGTPVSGMLALEVDKQELIKRLMERGKTSGRSDDCGESIIENRIVIYNEKTAPLIEYYNGQGKYFPVDGMGTVEDIAQRLNKIVKGF